MAATIFQDIKSGLCQLYLEDERPWLVGFSGDERMEKLIEFRETLLFYRDPANGKRDNRRITGRLRGAGVMPRCLDRLRLAGLHLDPTLFEKVTVIQ